MNMQVIQLGPTLKCEDQIGLCNQFSSKDIKDALFSIPSIKSPGPDRFNSGFFKAAWGTIGPLVCSTIQEFFHTRVMPSYISATKLIVLPKVPNLQSATNFKPISYYNTIYKSITKLLSQMIKTILPHLIDPSQGAFIKGRELLYNVLICQDIARGYQRKGISLRCILIINLKKAFNSVH